MTPTELLACLHERDVQLWVEGDRLHFKGPKGALTPELRALLGEQKTALLELLGAARNAMDGAHVIPVAARDCELLPSYSQERMWQLDQWDHEKAIFNIASAAHFAGPLDLAVLRRSVNTIFRRHEGLRTTFPAPHGRPLLRIAPAAPLQLPLLDLSGLPEDKREYAARQISREVSLRPFDLAHERLLRVVLLRLGPDTHELLLTTHHIVFDGWSSGLFQWELGLCYNALIVGAPSPLAELPIQYTDYAAWQRAWLQGDTLEAKAAYWRRRLAGAPPLFGPRPGGPAEPAARQAIVLPQQLVEQLSALSRHTNSSPFLVLLTTFELALAQFTGQSDIVVGVSVANRTRAETERLLGFFANTVVVRTDLAGAPGFDEALRRVSVAYLDAYEHHDTPIELLLRLVGQEHVEVLFNFVPYRTRTREQLGLRDVAISSGRLDPGPPYQYPHLLLALGENAAGLIGGNIIYKTTVFSAEAIERLTNDYLALLEAVARGSSSLSVNTSRSQNY